MSSYPFIFDEDDVHEAPQFDNVTEKMTYWKQKAEMYRSQLQCIQEDFESRRKIEVELETQLEEYEGRIKTLLYSKDKLEAENQDFLVKLEDMVKHTLKHITELSNENIYMKELEEDMAKYIQELEISNANHETVKSTTWALLDRYKGSLEEAMDKNSLLECKLKAKEQDMLTLKRLQDECRDLKGALAITIRDKAFLKQSKLEFEEAQAYANFMHLVDSNKLSTHDEKSIDFTATKTGSWPAFKAIGNAMTKLGSYKQYIQDIMVGTSKSIERKEDIRLNVVKNKNTEKPIDDMSFSIVNESQLLPQGISEHYVDMVNNLSTGERVSYCTSKAK